MITNETSYSSLSHAMWSYDPETQPSSLGQSLMDGGKVDNCSVVRKQNVKFFCKNMDGLKRREAIQLVFSCQLAHMDTAIITTAWRHRRVSIPNFLRSRSFTCRKLLWHHSIWFIYVAPQSTLYYEEKNMTKKTQDCWAGRIPYQTTMGQHSSPKSPAADLFRSQRFMDCC